VEQWIREKDVDTNEKNKSEFFKLIKRVKDAFTATELADNT